MKSTKVLPYVYVGKHRITNQIYVGYRYRNYTPSSEDLGKHYFTSNTYVKKNFADFDFTIVAEFFDRKSAYKFESQLIKEYSSANSINNNKYQKFKQYETVEVDSSIKNCALPECNKTFSNWRRACCSLSHQNAYSALKRHNKV